MEHRTNEEILKFYRNNPKPTEKLAGPHNERRPPLRTIIEGRMEEKTQRGRLRMVLLDWIRAVRRRH